MHGTFLAPIKEINPNTKKKLYIGQAEKLFLEKEKKRKKKEKREREGKSGRIYIYIYIYTYCQEN